MSLEGKSVDDIQALAELTERLSNDPKTRNGFLRLTKTLNPDASIPEIDIRASLETRFAEPLKELDALKKRAAERDLQDRIREQRKDIPAKEVAEVEKLMVEKKIADHGTAYEHLQMSRRAAEPTPSTTLPGARRLEKPTLPEGVKPGMDMQDWSRSTAYGLIDQLRGRRAAA